MPLDLSEYKLIKKDEKEHDIIFHLSTIEKPLDCKFCYQKTIRKYRKRNQFYFDIPSRGKRVGLQIEVQSYLCKECNKSFIEELPKINATRSMTNRLLRYIEEKSLQRPFTHLAEEIGCAEGTIRKIFKVHVENLAVHNKFETPTVMGIDEIHLAKRARTVITNISERTIIEMFKDRNKTTIIKYLQGLENSHIVLNVAIDMWKPYRDAVNGVLPHSVVAIDKFHVVKMANSALEKYRKELRASLTSKQRIDLKNDRFLLLKRKSTLSPKEDLVVSYWENNYPILAKMYLLKEQFFEIYEADSKEEAYTRYSEFENQLTSEVKSYWHEVTRALGNWHKEIFAYFDYPVTNAYTEAMNSVIRHVDRMGRSYSFETIRAKMLYTKSIHKTQRPKMDKKVSMQKSTMMEMSKSNYGLPTFVKKIKVQNFGVDMEKLAKLIDEEY
jgi:transposase